MDNRATKIEGLPMNKGTQGNGALTIPSKQGVIKIVIFNLLFWSVGVGLAYWFGLGWFFLLGTFRRLFIAIPWLYIPTVRVFFGSERSEAERRKLSESTGLLRWHYALQTIIILAWIALTVFAFAYVNVRLKDLVFVTR